MSETNLEQRIARLEAIDAIKRLKYIYMGYCDIGYVPEKLGPQFTEDAVWDGGEFGRHEGRAAIEEFFSGISSDIVFAAHLAINGIVEVDEDGDRGTGKWRMLMPCTMMNAGEKECRWILGDYDDVYVKQNGVWLFQSVNFYVNFNVDYTDGWAEVASIRS